MNGLSMKCPIYEMSFYEMYFYKMFQRRNIYDLSKNLTI